MREYYVDVKVVEFFFFFIFLLSCFDAFLRYYEFSFIIGKTQRRYATYYRLLFLLKASK